MDAAIMSDRPSSEKLRRACLRYWRVEQDGQLLLPCHCDDCQGALFNPRTTKWDADHRIRGELGGSDDPPNVRPLKEVCHKKKAAEDLSAMHKDRRQSDRVHGVKRPRGFYRPPAARYDWERRRYVRDEKENE
jgi:hypothetical protein